MPRLDRIYVRGFRITKAQVHRGKPWSLLSDHLALSAELESAPGQRLGNQAQPALLERRHHRERIAPAGELHFVRQARATIMRPTRQSSSASGAFAWR